MDENVLCIVHCVDTEGPHYESLEATFERLEELFGIKMEPSEKALRKIQNREIDFGPRTDIIARVFDARLLSYNSSWERIDAMLKRILSREFRLKIPDSFGGGWVYNWFCCDHVGYESNPRHKDVGYHNIFDYYRSALKRHNADRDGIYWHFHPMSFYRESHRCATSYVNSPHLYETLCRRIIERKYFPSAVRAGFQTERPDSHLFFEQWIPFDFTNWAYRSDDVIEGQLDIQAGRLGDWRLAPDDWSIYHPSFDSWQVPGNCRRWIARCIDILTRARELSQPEVDKAFARAAEGKRTLMAFNNHDVRDMSYEVDHIREKIAKSAKRFPQVKFKFCDAVEAFRITAYGSTQAEEGLELIVTMHKEERRRHVIVETRKGRVFGPQPFLAIRTKSGKFVHDNFNFDTSLTKWSYTFDHNSIHPEDVSAIGVAANDKYGNTFVKVIEITD